MYDTSCIKRLLDIDPVSVSVLHEWSKKLISVVETFSEKNEAEMEKHARRLSITAGLLMQALLLGEAIPHAISEDGRAELRFRVFVENNLSPWFI